MDVDNELEGKLLQQFSSLGTTDKEVLISEFQRLLGPNQITAKGCEFFLDMNNWNLQAAICSYYDFDQPVVRLPSMKFIGDVTIGEGEAVQPITKFIKTWRIRNCGDDAWPPGCCLRYCSGENLSNSDRAMVDALQPGQEADVSLEMRSPSTTGVYESQWRMCTPTGINFGEVIWVIIVVDEGGLLGVTQQLSQFGNEDFVHNTSQTVQTNPFASPNWMMDYSAGSNSLASPNSSIVAQHGSPYTTHLSPSPGVPPPQNTLTPRSLFQTQIDFNCDQQKTDDLDMS
ncbi:hypothetical protein KUTeg_023226 [Tegillarca granosa]|uniref:Nbr1 FW domain-containing protein n=1 Tax=Tegillarca granosa TaxID=220873 RepID=A0ABQ9E110_TEGGR|nr:hypothetical protein KUTeg_023226 [Tegillarca granosa]